VMQSVSTVISPMHLTMFLAPFFTTFNLWFVSSLCELVSKLSYLQAGVIAGFCPPHPLTFLHYKVWCFSGHYPWTLTVQCFYQLYLLFFCTPASCLPMTSKSSVGLDMWRTANSCNPTLTLPVSGVWTMELISV
jgi:hypothetical protein